MMLISVAGLSYPNSDGSSRQEILALSKVEEALLLDRDSSNPYDYFAIRVCRKNGQQLGFVPKMLARRLAPKLDQGVEVPAVIKKITDQDEKGYHRCHIEVDWEG